MIAEYFQQETAKLADQCLSDIKTLADWQAKRKEYRRQLFEMLGLDPLPEKTDLQPVVTGKVEQEEFVVEKLHFQSRPRLYVTANLYIPKGLKKPAPTILYVCGHGAVKKNGVSYGNKARYQHHGAWFARHGYVCLIIDSLQLGEIEGIHHGTYRYKMWWWNSRGYSSAAVEAWNCIRALDYLETRPEIIDAKRIGVTGRSGGGAYSWWISALDERIQAAVPVAGITDLQNHVVTGCVEGHCDCMYIVNTYRWDYPQVAALVAPRPLLISNSDKDGIFPLDGVYRTHQKVRKIYRLYDADKNLGLQITEGPHKDTQELRVHAFSWFNRFLKKERPLITKTAEPLLEVEQLKVFDKLPEDQINTEIQETFIPLAKDVPVPQTQQAWRKQRKQWLNVLQEKCFRGWPTKAGSLKLKEVFQAEQDGMLLRGFEFTSQPTISLPIFVVQRSDLKEIAQVELHVLGEESWQEWLAGIQVGFTEELKQYGSSGKNKESYQSIQDQCRKSDSALVYFAPRGIGPTAWDFNERKRTHIRRRFMLLGQTLDGMRVWDVRRAIRTVRSIPELKKAKLQIHSTGMMAGIALYASLFETKIESLFLRDLPKSHRNQPIFLNILRFLDMPQAAAMAAERCRVNLHQQEKEGWDYPQAVKQKLGWPEDRFQIHSTK
jgi:dienelactone hydrolase